MRNKKAFTLLELLMVVIIIGILATIAVPQYQNFREKVIVSEVVRILGAEKRKLIITGEYNKEFTSRVFDTEYWHININCASDFGSTGCYTAQLLAFRNGGPYDGAAVILVYDDPWWHWSSDHPYGPNIIGE